MAERKKVMTIFIIYLIISVVVGIVDIKRLQAQEDYFASIPYGDLESYEPKPITGVHNWVVFPSWIVIIAWKAIVRFVNNKIDG